MKHVEHFAAQLDILKQQGNLRQFTSNVQQGRMIRINDHEMLNLASNDYLGLAANIELREQFFDETPNAQRWMSSASSRLLTGNFAEYEHFEASLSQAFHGRSALVFNSGYHMNIGILPALADSKTLILADKLIHASMIDGIRLSTAKMVRYRHNDLAHLTQLLQKYHTDDTFAKVGLNVPSHYGDNVPTSLSINEYHQSCWHGLIYQPELAFYCPLTQVKYQYSCDSRC